MAKILSYDSPQVQNAQLDAARLNPGAAGNPLGDLGQGLGQAARGFREIQHEADVMRVTDAFNPFETDASNIVQRMRQVTKKQVVDPSAYGGDQGMSLTETALADLDKAAQARREGLNPNQQRMFDAAVQRKKAEVQRMVSAHETEQVGAMFQQIYQDRDAVLVDNLSKLGVKDGLPDGEVIRTTLVDRVDNARRWASSQGLDPDLAEQAAKAGAYGTVINGLLAAKNPVAAQAFFADHKMDLDEKTRLVMGEKISQQVQANQVMTLAQEIVGSGKPLDQQLAMVDEKAKGNADLLTHLRAEVEHRFTVQEKARHSAMQDAEGSIWGAVFPADPKAPRMSINQSIAQFPDAWAKLGGDGAAKLRAQLEAYGRRNENDPNLAVQRNLAYYNLITDPNFVNLTDNQIKALTPALGPGLTVQVMKDLHEIRTSPAKLQEMKLDHDVLEASAKELGLIAGDKATDAEKLNLAIMSSQAKQIMQSSGQKWSYENQVKLYKQLGQQIVTDRGWLWDTKAPLFQVQTTTQIPQAFLDTVAKKAKALGQPVPSTAMTYQLWFDAKRQGLVDDAGNPTTQPEATSEPGS